MAWSTQAECYQTKLQINLSKQKREKKCQFDSSKILIEYNQRHSRQSGLLTESSTR